MMYMRIRSRLFLVGIALGLALAGCGDGGETKSSETTITALTLTMGGENYDANITGTSATVEIPANASIPDTATVKSVALSAGASGLAKDQELTLTEGSVTVTITAEDGTTKKEYTVTVTIDTPNLSTVALSYASGSTIRATEGFPNDTGILPAWDTGNTGYPIPDGITYSITSYDGNGTDGTTGETPVVKIEENTGKITITASAIQANNGPYTVTATAGASSNYLNDRPLTATVTVSITPKVGLNTTSFLYAEVKATEGTANTTGVMPVWDQGSPTPEGITYEITGYTATGGGSGTAGSGTTVVIAPATGKITITAGAKEVNSGTYTVTATAGSTSNYDDATTQTAPVTVSIKKDLSIVPLTYTDVETTEGTAHTTGVDPAWEDTTHPAPNEITYSITASTTNGPVTDGSTGVSPGVAIAPGTGKITITAAATVGNSGIYEVTATAGADSNYAENTKKTATVTVKVKGVLSNYSLSYPMAKHSADGSISASPIWKKGTADEAPDSGGVSYDIDPVLPTGLTLNADGTISGTVSTMLSLDKVTKYQITATGNNIDYEGSKTGIFLDKFVSGEYSQVTTGTAISNLPELQAMATAVTTDPSGEYYLTAHIDLTSAAWTPIASSTTPFTGKLYGNGYAIYNLTINAETATHQGLLASVSGATIDNLSIGVTNIKGKAAVGALAGVANDANLSNIAVAPMVADAKIEAIGIVDIDGTTTSSYLGGLVGRLQGGSLTGYNLVSVEDTGAGDERRDRIGGLVGENNGGIVSGYTTGGVSAASWAGEYIGGLVGYNNGTVSGYTIGRRVYGYGGTYGGLVGANYGTVSGYATGQLYGNSVIGGLTGYANSGSRVTGYATGSVDSHSSTITGGLVAQDNNSDVVSGGYWDKQSTGQDTSEGGATAVGISATKNIVFASGSYTDSGNSNTTIFNNATFTAIFDTENGASKTWPKLKSSYTFNGIDFNFDFPQPTVTVSASDDDTIEVAY